MKAKNIIILLIIGIISSLYITEKSNNYILSQQLVRQLNYCKLGKDDYKQFFNNYLAKKRNELNKLNRKFTNEEKE